MRSPILQRRPSCCLALTVRAGPAATFAADQTALALKAATSLKLQTLKIETAEQTDLAKQLRVGAILAAGRATVPLVSKALFDKLLALRPTSAAPPRGDAPAAASPQLPATASNQPQSKRSPAAWAEIDVGDLVLVENWEPETGWYTRPWSSRSLATTSSNSGSEIIPKKEPWSAAAISWRCCRRPDDNVRRLPGRRDPSLDSDLAHDRPRDPPAVPIPCNSQSG
jgi:hypothetical protein